MSLRGLWICFATLALATNALSSDTLTFRQSSATAVEYTTLGSAAQCGGIIPDPVTIDAPGSTSFSYDILCGSRELKGKVIYTYPNSVSGSAATDGIQFNLDTPAKVGINASLTITGPGVSTYQLGAELNGSFQAQDCYASQSGSGTVTVTGSCSVPMLGYSRSLTPKLTIFDGFENVQLELYVNYGIAGVILKPYFEVVQVTQRLTEGDVNMVRGRPTVARVFARQFEPSSGPFTNQITARLHAWQTDKDGKRVLQLEDAKQPPGSIAATHIPDGDNPHASLVFKFPDSWISSQYLEVQAELVPPSNITTDPSAPATATRNLTFLPSSPFRILWLPFAYVGNDGKTYRPSANLQNYADFLKRMYPMAPGDIKYVPLEIGSIFSKLKNGVIWNDPIVYVDEKKNLVDDGTRLLNAVMRLTTHAKIPAHDMAVAFLPSQAITDQNQAIQASNTPTKSATLGMADAPFYGGKGQALWIAEDTDPAETQSTLAHEASHNLGLRHTNLKDSNECSLAPDSTMEWQNVFHYKTGGIQEPGFDTLNGMLKPTWFYDLMGYCPPAKSWIAPAHYNQLIQNRPNQASALSPNAITRNGDSGSPDYWVISGSVNQDGSAGTLDPALRVPADSLADVGDPNGRYCLAFTSGSGTVSNFCFTPTFVSSEEAQLSTKYFLFQVPYIPGTMRLDLISHDPVNGDRQLASLNGGAGAPSLSISSPQAGDQWSGTATITWNGSDPAGLALGYLVDYSHDGGDTWFPLTLDPLTDSQLSIDTGQLVGGPNVMFRVAALNGLETTYATVGPLNISQSPQVAIPSDPVDFGTVALNQHSSAGFSLSNNGTGPYLVNSLTIDNPDFRVQTSVPFYLWPGDDPSTIPISFLPSTAGPVKATLTINGDMTLTLVANVTNPPAAPAIAISPASLTFGPVALGLPPTTMPVTISNTGEADLHVQSIAIMNTAGDSSFSLAAGTSTAFTVAAGKSADVMVQFAPTAAIAVSASLSIMSDDPVYGTAIVSLAGSANPPAPASISLSSSSLSFGNVPVGQAPGTQLLMVTNSGGVSVTVTAKTSAPFSVSPGSLSLAAGQSGTLTVSFTPTATGSATGSLTVSIGSPNDPPPVTLSGNGVIPTISPSIIRTMGYHEITRFSKEVRFSNGGMPVLSAGSNRIVYAHAPGDETDARYNHIFVINADGSGQREVDVYKQNCSCGAIVDISADGNTVVSTDGIELRIASASASAGSRLITNREIPYIRISPRGDKVFFINRRGEASMTDATTERGLYVINADGGGLKQIAGPKAVAALLGTPPDKVFPFATDGWSLDVSADGSRVIFGVAAPGGERILSVNADGSGLKPLIGPVDFVVHAALSGDGSKVAYDVIAPPCCSTPNEVGVINFDGSNRKALAKKTSDIGSSNRIELNGDGSQLLYGGTSDLYATDGSGVLQLSVRGGYYSSDSAPLVTDGFGQPTMNTSASRFVYIVRDDAGIPQLATLDMNPGTLGDAPAVTAPTLSQASIALNGASRTTLSATVTTANKVARVSAAALNAGTTDPNVDTPVMLDDGANGDLVAGDGIYTGRMGANCCALLGPKNVRVKAEVRDSGNRRHATAIEFGGLTVVSNNP